MTFSALFSDCRVLGVWGQGSPGFDPRPGHVPGHPGHLRGGVLPSLALPLLLLLRISRPPLPDHHLHARESQLAGHQG